MAGNDRTPESVPVLLEAAWAERETQLAAIDGLDSKSGVVLGFAGAIVALTPAFPQWWMRLVVVVLPVISAALAVVSLWVRRVKTIEAPPLREGYLLRPLGVTQQTIFDTLVHQQPSLKRTLTWKGRWTQAALSTLAAGVLVMAVMVVVVG